MKNSNISATSSGKLYGYGCSNYIISPSNIFLKIEILFIILLTINTIAAYSDNHHALNGSNPLTLKICKETVQISRNRQIYIVNLRGDRAVTPLIQDLHKSSILTSSVTHHNGLSHLAGNQHQKNTLFFLKETNDIFSLILTTASLQRRDGIYGGEQIFTSVSDGMYLVQRELPNYCVINSLVELEQANLTCDFRVHITPAELEGKSPLTDHLLTFTRGLYSHDIWNYKNYIVFIIDKRSWRGANLEPKWRMVKTLHHPSNVSHLVNEDETDSCNLVFLFDFFWRFFRGQRTIICFEAYCVWYDRIERRLVYHRGFEDERYFDFSFRGFRDNIFRTTYGFLPNVTSMFSGSLLPILAKVIEGISDYINCTEDWFYWEGKGVLDGDIGLKHNLDLILCEGGFRLNQSEQSKFHYSPSFDSVSFCILAPRRGFMPQFLVVVKCFSPPVWVAMIMALVTSWLMQWLFQWFQVTHFAHYYSETEIFTYENSPAFFTIYAYLLSGSPPTLLLGKFFTGKICFLIFTFLSLILGTVLQSGMTTLLSSYVRYSDIETLKEFEQSELHIQTYDIEFLSDLLDHAGHSPLKTRLSQSILYYYDYIEYNLFEMYHAFFENKHNLEFSKNDTSLTGEEFSSQNKIEKNLALTVAADAFLARVPYETQSVKNRITYGYLEDIEFHIVDECLTTYPYSHLVVKNSILTDVQDNITTWLLENGEIANLLRTLKPFFDTEAQEACSGEGSLRSFSMIDLQLAFISLGLGHFISVLVFVIELYIGLSK
ncbi:unnamed protein product [Bemisia tabaci]|uniref:Ionotropic receptor n=1 Tax=Bemisia tabaci TaxID=7038 RepID=A0A9P0F446_BEMTA|nr:unnamed protein product [Bemisia tabaci]